MKKNLIAKVIVSIKAIIYTFFILKKINTLILMPTNKDDVFYNIDIISKTNSVCIRLNYI